MAMAAKHDPVLARAGDTLRRRCEFYAELGLPVELVDRDRIALRVGGLVGAVTMPAALGRKIAPSLRVRAMSAPVIAHPGDNRWTVLSGPGHTVPADHATVLLRLGVSVVGESAQVVVPSPQSECLGLWRWIHWPARTDLPALGALLATTLAMAQIDPHVRRW
jgi:hypothetical protein